MCVQENQLFAQEEKWELHVSNISSLSALFSELVTFKGILPKSVPILAHNQQPHAEV